MSNVTSSNLFEYFYLNIVNFVMLISKHMRLYGDAYLSKSPGSLYLGPGTDNFVFLKRYIEEKSKEKKKLDLFEFTLRTRHRVDLSLDTIHNFHYFFFHTVIQCHHTSYTHYHVYQRIWY